MPSPAAVLLPPIDFPPYRLDLRAGQLSRDGTPVRLRPKTFAVLHHLAERPGELVTKQALLDAVWGDVAVSEDVVRLSIGELRTALGDQRTVPHFVETVPRRGYRFMPAVKEVPFEEPHFAGRVMLAVLPLENLTGSQEQEYFVDGLTDEIITALGGLSPQRLGVIARTSAMQYKRTTKRIDQISRELGVDYIIEGAVRREGNRVRITAQLI